MSEPELGPMQFDIAESADVPQADAACAVCKSALTSYFAVRGHVLCGECKNKVEAAHAVSHLGGLLGAAALGVLAAAAGAALYYGVTALTGYRLGLIAIVVGLMVGFAVRKGSGGRGGWRYQALAMALVYLAVSASYVAQVVEEVRAKQVTLSATAPAGTTAPGALTRGEDDPVRPPMRSPVVSLMAMAFLVLALPILVGKHSLMSLVILGIALYEAWKVNRARPFVVTGPFAVGAPRNA